MRYNKNNSTSQQHTQDVHAGNLLVLEDGRVAFIDFGIVGRFSPDTWTGVSRLADGVAEEDFTVMAEVRAIFSCLIKFLWLTTIYHLVVFHCMICRE